LGELFVVGGASRCGKSTVLKAFMGRHQRSSDVPLATIATDSVLNALWHEHDGQYDQYPELMQQVIDSEGSMDEAEWIAFQANADYLVRRQHTQSKAVWDMRLGSQIRDHLIGSGDTPLLVEGIALLPDFVAPLARIATVHAIYLGNESPSHADSLIIAARSTNSPQENWMHDLSDKQIRAYMLPKEAMSRRIGELAAEYGFPYIDMGEGGFSANVNRAIDMLMAVTYDRHLGSDILAQ
jgi:hypothetical protein